MILNGKNTINFTVNYLAELVLNEIPKKHNTIIEVFDVGNFFLFKGKTDYEDTLDLFSILGRVESENFDNNFSKKLSHIVDLIEYGDKPSENVRNRFCLYNSENPLYHQSQLNFYRDNSSVSTNFDYELLKLGTNLTCQSDFPFGYSFNHGRNKLLYSKLLLNNIPPNYPFSSLIFEYPESEKNLEEIKIFDIHSKNYDDNLKSAFLDYFDFNFESLRKNFEEIETGFEIKNPTLELDFLKRKSESIIII